MTEDFNFWFHRRKNDPRLDWRNGETNWIEGYVKSVNHPHRELILDALDNDWESLLELGCNAGPNLFLINQFYPNKVLAGLDASPEAIIEARKNLPHIDFKVENLIKLPYKNYSFDIILIDAVLMYISDKEIRQVMKEIDRTVKKQIILIEWDDDSNLGVVKNHHWARNYKLLLEDLGFEVKKSKITKKQWPNKSWIENGYLYVAHRPLKTGKKKS